MEIAIRIAAAREAIPSMTQRDLETMTGISQSTLHRIETGARDPKMNELIAIAGALGVPLGHLTGNSIADRLVCAARTTNPQSMLGMRAELSYYFEIEEYLDQQAIPELP